MAAGLDGLAEFEIRLRESIVRAPSGKPAIIGVAGRRKVHPIAGHEIGQIVIGRLELTVYQVEVVEDIEDLRRMIGSESSGPGERRDVTEEVEISPGVAGGGQPGPGAHLQGEGLIA